MQELAQTTLSIDEEILRCIDDVLLTYGRAVSKAIFWHCSFISAVKKSDIPSNPEVFEKNLQMIFGSSSSTMVASIVKQMKRKFDLPMEESVGLKDTIDLIKKTSARS